MNMHLITFGVIFILVQPSTRYRIDYLDSASDSYSYGVFGTPLPQDPSITINPYIRHWEPARYDREHLDRSRRIHENFRRRKRETNSNSQSNDYGLAHTVRLKFFAHDKQFNVVLKEDPASVFSPEVEIENTLGPVVYDVSRVYTGTLEDDEGALVHGILTTDNLFDGTITTKFEHYYIEPSSKYTKDLHGNGIHSIVYKASDVDQPVHRREIREEHIDVADEFVHHCASERLNRNLKVEMEKEREPIDKNSKSNANVVETTIRKRRFLPDELAETQNPPLPLDLDVPYNDDFNVYSPKHDDDTNSEDMTFPNSKNHLNRKNILINDFNPNTDFNMRDTQRNRNIIINNFDTTNSSRPSHKTHVEIITKNGATKKPNIIVNNYNPDVILTSTNFHHNTIHQHVRNDIIDATSKSSYDRKITCMLYLQADHTFFQKMGSDEASIEAITRHVQRANFIYKNTDFNGDGKPDNITFMIKRIKVHNSNALKDPTYRFPGNYGVEKFLELFSEEDYDAFCLAYMFTYRDFEMGTLGLAWTGDLKNAGGVCEKNGHYRGSLKSLNTGIVTLLNYGKHVPPAVSHVTLAHEIGHNFGSPHDPEQCTPGGEDGNYIMFARATSGDKRNNNKFSPCSLKAIEPVLNAKARSAKGCFTEPQQAICGNGVVDPGEQCDCGWEEDCTDKCCYPMSRHPKLDEKPCTLTPQSKCSPSQGPCCTIGCALKFGDKCRDDNGCRDPSYCDGNTPTCPPSINKANKTICNKEFVCYMGECTGSICLAYGLESCQCIPTASDPKTKACELCCKLPGEDSPCKSSFEWNEVPFDVPDMFAKPGTPCNDYNGYCDVFQKCREVDPSGPLATLRKLLLSEESIASFKKWMQSNWYTVALVIVAVIVLLTLSTKLLGKGTSLKQKSVTIIHSATTETVRLPDDNNGVIVHTAIRTKVPFKKKVRGERSNKIKTKPTTSKTTPTKSEGKLLTTQIPTAAAAAAAAAANSKVFKRQTSNVTATGDSPKKITKKKKRVSAPVVDEDQNKALTEPAPIKTKKLKKTKSKHKEIIDYSKRSENHSNTFGKVSKWLLESPIASQPLAEVEHTSKVRNIMSKSQSTPERLAPRSPKKVKSLGNLNDKVKLQVVYKPPFKFSLKLSKNSAVKTKVIGAVGRNKRKVRADKHRDSAADAPKSSRRTALLIRTVDTEQQNQNPSTSKAKPTGGDDVVDSTYDTLNVKNTNSNSENNEAPVYENVAVGGSTGRSGSSSGGVGGDNNVETAVNSATFRINKSVSGSNLNKPQVVSPNSNSSKPNKRSNQIANSSKEFRNSSTNLLAATASSSHNLVRSSTTNLAKNSRSSFDMKRGAYDLSRSSTTNLSKEHRHGSQLNLLKHRGGSSSNLAFDDVQPQSRSRKNSTNLKSTDSSSKTNIPRIPSNSNLKLPSLHRGSVNNIPRASLNIHSKTAGPPYPGQFSQKQNASARADQSGRPHTTDCTEVKRFEWPDGSVADKFAKIDLPSDLEVMVSDVENLVNDT